MHSTAEQWQELHGAGELQAERVGRRRISVRVASSAEAAELISRGNQIYKEGNRMGALKLYERVPSVSPSKEQLQEAYYAMTCVHASFGDVETAQMTVRSLVGSGLDFEAALENPDYLKMQASPQMLVQLKKFARTLKQIRGALQPAGGGRPTSSGLKAAPRSAESSRQNLSDVLRTDITGMDASVGGIVKRVLGLLVVALVVGTALFYIGLFFTFPESR